MPGKRDTISLIEAQLAPGTPQAPTVFDRVLRAREEVDAVASRTGTSNSEARAAAARYGQLATRGWQSWLVGALTDFAITKPEAATRERVRAWQQSVFGTANASASLARWAQPGGAGARGSDGFADPLRTEAARELFERFRDAMKPAIERRKSK
jgi:hypothetical protein